MNKKLIVATVIAGIVVVHRLTARPRVELVDEPFDVVDDDREDDSDEFDEDDVDPGTVETRGPSHGYVPALETETTGK